MISFFFSVVICTFFIFEILTIIFIFTVIIKNCFFFILWMEKSAMSLNKIITILVITDRISFHKIYIWRNMIFLAHIKSKIIALISLITHITFNQIYLIFWMIKITIFIIYNSSAVDSILTILSFTFFFLHIKDFFFWVTI